MDGNFAAKMGAIAQSMQEMEQRGEVDFSVVPRMDEAIQSLLDSERRILEREGADPRASFLSYHIIRNIRMALVKMKMRIQLAGKGNDNPSVALDSLEIIPVLERSYRVAQQNEEKRLSETDEFEMIECARTLRETLLSKSMTTAAEERDALMSQTGLENEWRILAEAVKGAYIEEQQSTV